VRIVSLCPSLTELVFDLGRGEDLVGITRFCVHPADGVGAIEKVGGTKNPDVERIAALRPDVVLLNREENRIEDAEALAARGLHCHSSMPRTPGETAAMVRSIAVELERGETGETIALDIEERTRRVVEAARGQREVTYAYLIWREPWMSVNRDTFADALLTQAGGRNVFGGREERYPELTLEELVSADPMLVLLGTEPYPFRQEHIEELVGATGFSAERFSIADGEYLSWHGSRTPDGVDYAAGRIARARRGATG